MSLHEFLAVPEALRPYVPNFHYSLLDLSGMSDEDIKGELFLRIFLLVMKHIDSPKLGEYLKEVVWPLFNEFFEEGTGLEYLESVLYYLFQGSAHLNDEEVIQQVQETLTSKGALEVIMTIAEQLEQKGFQQGEIQVVTKLLQLKFGSEAEAYSSHLSELSVLELEALVEKVMNASSLEEVFEGSPKRS